MQFTKAVVSQMMIKALSLELWKYRQLQLRAEYLSKRDAGELKPVKSSLKVMR